MGGVDGVFDGGLFDADGVGLGGGEVVMGIAGAADGVI